MSTIASDLSRREMFAEIKKLCAPDNTTNWWVLLREYAVYAAVVAACIAAYNATLAAGWSIGWMLPVYLAAVITIGVWTQNRLACLVHEASHYSLFKNRVLNDLAANAFVAFPFFAVISNYRIGHWGHHRHVNDPERDPDLLRLVKHHPRKFPVRQMFYEYVLLQLTPWKAYTYLKGRASYVAKKTSSSSLQGQEVLTPAATWALRISFYAVLFGTLFYFDWFVHYLLFWIVPMLTFYPATLFLREVGHHGNYPDNGDYTNSRVYEGYWLEREIFFPFSEQNHVIHHMFPTVPWHKIRQAHDVLMRYKPYRENVIICDGFFFKCTSDDRPTVVDILKHPSPWQLRNPIFNSEGGSIRQTTSEEVGAVAVEESRIAGES